MPGLAARADRRLSPGRLLLLGLLVWLLAACTPSGQVTPPVPPAATGLQTPPATPHPGAQRALDSVRRAVLDRDKAAFDRQVAHRDPTFPTSAATLYANLTALPLTDLVLRLRPLSAELTASRRALLGPQATVRQVAVRWRLRGDVGYAEHLVWLTFLPASGGASQVGGSTDGPTNRLSQPIWLRQPVQARQIGLTTVVAAGGTDVAAWARRASAAVAAVRPRLHASLGAGWNRSLVLEVPVDTQQFEQVLGVTPGSYRQIAAVAWPEGPDPATAAIRIVVNPGQAGRLDEQGLAILLAHEAVHVATRSAASDAPTWSVEGVADYVAYDAYPRTTGTAAAALLARVRTDGAPVSLPADADFSPASPRLSLAYAEAWTACRLLADTYSPAGLDRFYASVSAGVDVDQALRSEFGLDTATFTARWHRSLESAAAKG